MAASIMLNFGCLAFSIAFMYHVLKSQYQYRNLLNVALIIQIVKEWHTFVEIGHIEF